MSPDDALTCSALRGDVFAADCPSREVMRHMTSRWGVIVLMALRREDRLRFSALRRRIQGVSERMLAQTLQALEADGIVARHALPVVPPHVEYTLTPLGREAAERLRLFVDWLEDNAAAFRPAPGAGPAGDPA